MRLLQNKDRTLTKVSGVLGVSSDGSKNGYYLLSKELGKLSLIYDSIWENELKNYIWSEIKIVGLLIKESHRLVPIEIIPPTPSEARAINVNKFKKHFNKLKGRIPRFEGSYLAAL